MKETQNVKLTLTIGQTAKVFGLYLGCKIRNKPYTGFPSSERDHYTVDGTLLGVNMTGTTAPITVVIQNFDAFGAKWDALTRLPIDDCKLILTPLSEITDEDLRKLAAYVKFEGEITIQRGTFAINIYDSHIRRMIFYHKGIFSNTRIYDKNGIEVIEYSGDIQEILRSLYYMIPYMGTDLYETGIAIKPNEAIP